MSTRQSIKPRGVGTIAEKSSAQEQPEVPEKKEEKKINPRAALIEHNEEGNVVLTNVGKSASVVFSPNGQVLHGSGEVISKTNNNVPPPTATNAKVIFSPSKGSSIRIKKVNKKNIKRSSAASEEDSLDTENTEEVLKAELGIANHKSLMKAIEDYCNRCSDSVKLFNNKNAIQSIKDNHPDYLKKKEATMSFSDSLVGNSLSDVMEVMIYYVQLLDLKLTQVMKLTEGITSVKSIKKNSYNREGCAAATLLYSVYKPKKARKAAAKLKLETESDGEWVDQQEAAGSDEEDAAEVSPPPRKTKKSDNKKPKVKAPESDESEEEEHEVVSKVKTAVKDKVSKLMGGSDALSKLTKLAKNVKSKVEEESDEDEEEPVPAPKSKKSKKKLQSEDDE